MYQKAIYYNSLAILYPQKIRDTELHNETQFIPYARRIISCHDVLDNNFCINHLRIACIRPLQAVHSYMHDMSVHLLRRSHHQLHVSEQNQATDGSQIGRHFLHGFPETVVLFSPFFEKYG